MKQRILIVEDEPAIADNLVYALETEGFECRWCATGGEGLRAIEQGAPGAPGASPEAPGAAPGASSDGSGAAASGPMATGFDLAVLDVGLPDMGGFDLCRAIRKRHDLPILFLTARSGEIDRVVGLELGADDYVVKPFSPREVAARIKAILRRTARGGIRENGTTGGPGASGGPGSSGGHGTGGPRADALPAPATSPRAADKRSRATSGFLEGSDPGAHSHPFFHDEDRKRIVYYGQVLELSRYEYRLLLVFLEKPGRVWSREQLMEKAWDSPESSLERTVDAHVKSLRAKLREAKPGVEAIVTHRGLGYSLKEDW